MKFLNSALLVLFLTACGQGGESAGTAKAADPTPSLGGSTPAVQQPVQQPVQQVGNQLTVYTNSLTRSVTENSVTNQITVTGYCAVYNSYTYCWDDGWHRPFSNVGYDYWGFVENGSTILQGNEGSNASTDPFEMTPIQMTTAIINQLPGNVIEPDGSLQTMVTEIFANGTSSQVTCTADSQQNLDCGTFTLTIGQ